MNFPTDIKKPFFSYGIFRPGEIAFHVLSEFVDLERIHKRTIQGSLKLRDGIVILDQNGNDQIEGYLLHFKDGFEKEAYEAIINLEPINYYSWNDSQSKFRKEFNILHGRTTNKGIDEEKATFNEKVWASRFDSSWDDPFILNGFQILKKASRANLELEQNDSLPKWDEEPLFNEFLKFQMLFLLLCSILERIMFLNGGFGKNPMEQLKFLSRNKVMNKVFNELAEQQQFSQFKRPFRRSINPSNNPSEKVDWEFIPEKEIHPFVALNYYYQLRSNITHRGKSGMKKYPELKMAFEELLFVLERLWNMNKAEADMVKENIDTLISKRNESN